MFTRSEGIFLERFCHGHGEYSYNCFCDAITAYLHLLGFLLQCLLVYLELLRHLGAGLPSEDVFQLHVQLLFLLDQQFLLDDFLRLRDESLLQRLDLLDHLVRARIAALVTERRTIYFDKINTLIVNLLTQERIV